MRTLGGEFIPQSNQDFITINAEMPPGTTLDKTDKMMLRIEDTIRSSPDVKDVLTTIGKSSGVDEGVEFANLLVVLPKGHKKHIIQINDELRTLLTGKFPGVILQNIPAGLGPGAGVDIIPIPN